MAVVPIITFFVLRDAAFSGAANADMWAGFGAVGAANVVVVAYVVMVRQQFCGDDVSLKKSVLVKSLTPFFAPTPCAGVQ